MQRRTFLSQLAGVFGSGCLGWTLTGRTAAAGAKPNILFINIDDLGWMDVGFNGRKDYRTPNLDRLASEGMTFTNAYAPAANCAPSRACVLSGQYTPRHGIYTVGNSDRGAAWSRKLVPVKNRTVLPDENVTLAEALKAGGYVTASMGKWHLGPDPCTQGFDVNVAGSERGHPPTYFSPYRNPKLKDGPQGEYLTDRLTDEAMGFVERHRDSNWCLYLPYFTVHSPWQGRKDLLPKYRDRPGKQAQYASMVEAMDENVGRLLAKLDALGLRDRTLVLFTSDNGGVYQVSRQDPLRAGKGAYYEGGIREPMVVRWPGVVSPGSRCDTPVSGIDFYPTLLAAAGVPIPAGKLLDGLSLMPLLSGTGLLPERPLFWHFPIYLQGGNKDTRDMLFRTRPGSVVRLGRWKLHEYFEDGGLELYDLSTDLGERHDLARERPEKVQELHALLKRWRKEVKAPVPTELNPKYDATRDRNARHG